MGGIGPQRLLLHVDRCPEAVSPIPKSVVLSVITVLDVGGRSHGADEKPEGARGMAAAHAMVVIGVRVHLYNDD